jgi:hypothetical protein
VYLFKKYKKWGVLRVAVCPSFIWDAGFLKVKECGRGKEARSCNNGTLVRYAI